jgi:CheY-like chemotaxis protein
MPQATSPAPHPSTARESGLPILIVEDNPDTAESLARLLEKCGHRCRVLHSGWHVLETALGFRPRVVLLDIALPGITGYEIARELRQHPALKGTMLISVSGYAQESDRPRALDSGFDHHLVKPVDFDVLRKLLGEILGADGSDGAPVKK